MITIKRVESKQQLTAFIQFFYDLYRGSEYAVPYLYSDEMASLSRDKNPSFECCEAEYFLAYQDNKVVGRVAAIINHRANARWNRMAVRFGWFDFIDDTEVSTALLKAVEDWGREKNMEYVVGPLGFTDMDPEGLLLYGYDELGTMATAYNYPYYPEHFDNMGCWEKDNDYVEYKLMVPDVLPEKYLKIAEMIQSRYNLHIRKLTRADVKSGYAEKMFDVINVCFAPLYGYSELSPRQKKQYVEMYLPMADLNLIACIEDYNTPDHKMVGVGISIPSIGRALQKCRNGRIWPFGWWHILRALKFHKTEVVDLLLIGVLPEYRAKGANSLLFYDLIPWYQKYGFKWGETHVEMETNARVQSQWQYLDCRIHKRRRCYVKPIGKW